MNEHTGYSDIVWNNDRRIVASPKYLEVLRKDMTSSKRRSAEITFSKKCRYGVI